jgi:indolepyruvate ferredoxin oxidoreductase
MNLRALSFGRLAAHDLAAVQHVARPGMRASALASGASGASGEGEPPKSLEQIVAHRSEMLAAYQSRAWAGRYRRLVDRVAAAEAACAPDSTRLASAVARYFAKLMAYKDEYEVARLYTDGGFRRQLESEFEGSFQIQLHLAPQMFFPKDPETGRARKLAVGPWVLTAFAWLARFKFLRGTPFDPFGWAAHRRLERALIGEYERTLDELCAALNPSNLDLAVEIASLPEGIRGFFDVKERHLADVRSKEHELLAAFRLRASAPVAR